MKIPKVDITKEIGIVRYSTKKQSNGSQEILLAKKGIKQRIVRIVSGFTKNKVIKLIERLFDTYSCNNLTIAVTEYDRISRQPTHWEDLINFLDQNNYKLTIYEITSKNIIVLDQKVYDDIIKDQILEAYNESKIKSDRNKKRNSCKESIIDKYIKQIIAFSCLEKDIFVNGSKTANILQSFGMDKNNYTINKWRKKYGPIEGEYIYRRDFKILDSSFMLPFPDYENLYNSSSNEIEKKSIIEEQKTMENIDFSYYGKFGITLSVIEKMCKTEENEYIQNIVYKIREEMEDVSNQMSEMAIDDKSSDEHVFRKKKIKNMLDEDLKKFIENPGSNCYGISPEQYSILFNCLISNSRPATYDIINYLQIRTAEGIIDEEDYKLFFL